MANPQYVTLVITHTLRPNQQQAYEQWLQRIVPIAEQFEGHLGANVIRPVDGGDTYTILIRFDNLDNLYRWTHSPERKALMEEVADLLTGEDRLDIQTGSQFWFTPAQKGVRRPAQWKQFLITLAVIFPSTLLVPWFWRQLLPQLSGTLPGHFLNDATVVALVVYLWMPLLTRVLAGWLKR
ncbi:antibiotic biosynthesis monooxygenase [Edaphovirga cremea]|uniref:antibiotic biosynthesis monooxygenase n=1 Tax=Edaphovirga cremea TaxID=2267246 RepID=UPI003988CDE8